MVPKKAAPLFLVYSASDLDGVVYRAVRSCPPILDDFRSYVELGVPHTSRQRFRATGISVSRERPALRRRMERFALGPAVATLDLRGTDAVWTGSGGRSHLQWFNVMSMADDVKTTVNGEFEYVLLDRLSQNFLGEWHTYDEAEREYLAYIAEAPAHVDRLELWRDDKRIYVDPAKIAAITAA